MYTREIGSQRIKNLAKDFTTKMPASDYKKGIYIDVPINYLGILEPTTDDANEFNCNIPNFEMIRIQEGQWHLRSYGIKKNDYFSSTDLTTGERHCLEQAYNFANTFLVSLSISTFAFVQWRQISLPSLTFHGSSLLRERPLHFFYPPGELRLINEKLDTLHIGHLVSAYEIKGTLLSWHSKFLSCYSKGQILLTSPSYIDLNFCDESYLNYFRCLEYLVMEKILERGGNFDNHRLAEAVLKIGASINGDSSKKAATAFSNKLNAQRGTAVAHLTRGCLRKESALTGQEVYELKSFVDLLTIKCVSLRQAAQAAMEQTTTR